jgi:hypothetical protein
MHIPCESHVLAFLVAHRRLGASRRPGLPSDLLSFGHSFAHARLGPSKVPQTGVDLVNMAAPPRVRACTIGTATLKSVPLLAAVLVWNSWGCISFQKASMEWEELCQEGPQPYVESGNRWGLVYPVNSFRFHDSSSLQAKFLKGAEENQVKRNVLVATIAASHPSVQWKNSWGRTNHILSWSNSDSAMS